MVQTAKCLFLFLFIFARNNFSDRKGRVSIDPFVINSLPRDLFQITNYDSRYSYIKLIIQNNNEMATKPNISNIIRIIQLSETRY